LVLNNIVTKEEISINVSQGVAENLEVVDKFSGKSLVLLTFSNKL